MNGRAEEAALRETSWNGSDFGLACHLSSDIRRKEYAAKTVSVEGNGLDGVQRDF